MILLSLSTILSVIITNVHFSASRDSRPPLWIRNFLFGHVARFLLQDKEAKGIDSAVCTTLSISQNKSNYNISSFRLKITYIYICILNPLTLPLVMVVIGMCLCTLCDMM